MKCDKYNKRERECILCKQAHDLWEIIIRVNSPIGMILLHSYFEILCSHFNKQEIETILDKVETLQELEEFHLNKQN